MRKILVATDFSARSDRALRRATLLAKTHEATLNLVHVIDDDRPKRIVDPEREAALSLLNEQAQSLREHDGVDCSARVVLGKLADEIVEAAQQTAADIVIVGSHRHNGLQDVFWGTTAERTIRMIRRPLLVANGVPANAFRHVLVAVDFLDCSAEALRAVATLSLNKQAMISAVHVYEAPARKHMLLASARSEDIRHYIASEEASAGHDLASFLQRTAPFPIRPVLKLNEAHVAHVICSAAQEVSADLIVVGTHGRAGIVQFLLGSVAQEVLHIADRDVLAVSMLRH